MICINYSLISFILRFFLYAGRALLLLRPWNVVLAPFALPGLLLLLLAPQWRGRPPLCIVVPILGDFLGGVVAGIGAVYLVATLGVELFGSETKVALRELLTVVCLRGALALSQVALGLAAHHHVTHLPKIYLFVVKLIRKEKVLAAEKLRPL